MATDEDFYSFCLNSSFWNESYYEISTWPRMTPCFQSTALVWIPCAWLWLTLPFYACYLYSIGKYTSRVPVNPLSSSKVLMCALLSIHTIVYLTQELTKSGIEGEEKMPPLLTLNFSLKLATFVLAGILSQVERVKGMVTSAVQFVFWLLLLLANTVPFYTKILLKTYEENMFDFIMFYIFYFFVIIQFVLICWAEKRDQSTIPEDQKDMCPEMDASIINRLYFWWMNGIVVKAYKKPLEESDVWSLGVADRSQTIVPSFDKKWEEEVAKANGKTKSTGSQPKKNIYLAKGGVYDEKTPLLASHLTVTPGSSEKKDQSLLADSDDPTEIRPSLAWAVAKTFGPNYLIALFFKFLSDVLQFASPILLGVLIDYADAESELPEWRGYIPALVLFLTTIVQSVFYHQNYHIGMTTGMRIKCALIAAIFKKSLTLRPSAKKSTTLGEIVNLMSVDCQRIQDTFTFTWSLMSCPLQLGIGILLLWGVLGPSCLAGLFVLMLMVPLNSIVVVQQRKLQTKVLMWKGKRIKMMNEIMNGMKVLKMYAWELSFKGKVKQIRDKELHLLRMIAYLQGATTFCWILAPFLVTLATFTIFILTTDEHFLDAKKAFVALAIFNILRIPINMLSQTISLVVQVTLATFTMFVTLNDEHWIDSYKAFVTLAVFNILRVPTNVMSRTLAQVAQAIVSIKRIENFLAGQDLDPGNVQRRVNSDYALEVENGIFTWSSSVPTPTLRDINLKVRDGQLIAIVGQVGCGKSSLMSALLGEMDKLDGRVNIRGSIAYVPQEAWIQNTTLMDNVLFGKPFLQKKYKKVIEACALGPDLEVLPGRDMTEIGEKGINISGGQKQRVSLARAVYSNSDVYLMDDPLSAVDSHVGKHIFEKVIGAKGLLKNKTRVLVTHGVHWLPMVDTVVVMVNGKISEIGSYEELISHDGAFAQFLKQYFMEEEESDVEDPPEIVQIKQKMIEQVESVTSEGLTTTDTEGQPILLRSRKRRTSERPPTPDHQKMDKPRVTERLTTDETSQQGEIKWSVFGDYAKGVGIWASIVVILVFSGYHAASVTANFWLTFWTEDEYLKTNTNISTTQEYIDRSYSYLTIYGILGIVQAVLVFIYAILMSIRMVVAAGVLHARMLDRVLQAPMAFFDTTPIGRITNRFSSDIDIMDNTLPLTFRITFNSVFLAISTLIVVTINTPIFLVVILPVAILYYFLMKFYIPTARQLKRIESVTRSPVYNHFSETVSGASVIRAFGVVDRFVNESMKRVDKHLVYYYANLSSARWLGVRLEILGNFLVLAASMFSIFSDLDGGTVGLSITYALQATGILNLLVVNFSDLANNIVCVERIKEYCEVETEAEWYNDKKPQNGWPIAGDIKFVDFKTRYRAGLDLVLKGINFEINHGEMIGIVGRTGAGKSSLTLSLFRLIEAAGGSIIIDGVRISEIGLHDLRSSITILPQDPVLFSGSLRMNLDPFDQYGEDELWQALESAHLKNFVLTLPATLEYQCGEGGSNLSVGQRQLVCLARTILKRTKILILDEATAAVDIQTDDLIQQTIRTEFRDCTVLAIAHRLNTILDYDRVMVLDDGQVVEFDTPANLLENRSTIFFGMAKDAGLTNGQISRQSWNGKSSPTLEIPKAIQSDPHSDQYIYTLTPETPASFYPTDDRQEPFVQTKKDVKPMNIDPRPKSTTSDISTLSSSPATTRSSLTGADSESSLIDDNKDTSSTSSSSSSSSSSGTAIEKSQ